MENSRPIHANQFENRPSLDESWKGVKTFEGKSKNANSVDDFHILSNLTKEQEAGKISYDGFSKEADFKKTTKQEILDQLSERTRYKRGL